MLIVLQWVSRKAFLIKKVSFVLLKKKKTLHITYHTSQTEKHRTQTQFDGYIWDTQEPRVKTISNINVLKQNLNECSQEHKKPSRQNTKHNHATTGGKEKEKKKITVTTWTEITCTQQLHLEAWIMWTSYCWTNFYFSFMHMWGKHSSIDPLF